MQFNPLLTKKAEKNIFNQKKYGRYIFKKVFMDNFENERKVLFFLPYFWSHIQFKYMLFWLYLGRYRT